MKLSDLLLGLVVVLFLGPTAYYEQWGLFGGAAGFILSVGIAELISIRTTGNTVSKNFWNFSKEHPKSAIGVLGSLAVGTAILLFHLAEKLF